MSEGSRGIVNKNESGSVKNAQDNDGSRGIVNNNEKSMSEQDNDGSRGIANKNEKSMSKQDNDGSRGIANKNKKSMSKQDNDGSRGVVNKNERVVSVKNKNISLIIAGGSIFAALSYGLQVLTAPFVDVLRVPGWFIAFFDPVSIIWVMSFLVFGIKAGLLTSAIGAVLLTITDNTPSGFIGPMMKFIATITLIVTPWIISKIRKTKLTSEYLLGHQVFIKTWIFAVLVRAVVMIVMNWLVLAYIYPMFFPIDVLTFNLKWLGLTTINGWTAVIITNVLINSLQSVWDYFVSYGVVKPISMKISLPW
jgi:riboflavin transporter FmnP